MSEIKPLSDDLKRIYIFNDVNENKTQEEPINETILIGVNTMKPISMKIPVRNNVPLLVRSDLKTKINVTDPPYGGKVFIDGELAGTLGKPYTIEPTDSERKELKDLKKRILNACSKE